ncbi:hypothetical protein [Streptomyces sp. NPDC058086]|uniref:hypothetical protein n=1 Tax=Streptomyces sp. NPDC058086 TaxID=3346334 RepID=UPI0036F0C7CE
MRAHDGLAHLPAPQREAIEAATHTGERALAEQAFEQLAGVTRPVGTNWALAVPALAQAQVREGDEAQTLYRDGCGLNGFTNWGIGARLFISAHTAEYHLRKVLHSADAGVLPPLYAATSPQARGGLLYGPDGLGQFTGGPIELAIYKSARSEADAARLWRMSAGLTGVASEQMLAALARGLRLSLRNGIISSNWPATPFPEGCCAAITSTRERCASSTGLRTLPPRWSTIWARP